MATALSIAVPDKQRDLSLDGIRFIAILMVITIHVSAKGFAAMGIHWWAVNSYESVSRPAVPLFFMVTGALLLSRETSAKTSLRRIWRVVLPLFAWSLIYLWWFSYTGTTTDHWLLTILRVPVVAHFWYLYTLIGVYVFLPVMIGFYRIENQGSQYLALLGCFLGSSVAPLLYALFQQTYLGVEWNFLPLYAGYVISGALAYKIGRRSTHTLWIAIALWLVCCSTTGVMTWKHSLTVGHADETFYVYSSPFVVLQALASFILLRALFDKLVPMSSVLRKFLLMAGKLNFGIYLVHVLVMFWLGLNGLDFKFINPWLGIPVTSAAVLLMSAGLVYLLQRIPYVKQTVPV